VTHFLIDAHLVWGYVTLFALLVALVLTFTALMSPRAEMTYRLTAIIVDLQVTLGVIVWLTDSGWSLGLVQGWVHPIVGLATLGVLHAFVARGRKADPEVAQRTVRLGIGLALTLTLVAIVIAATN
jgi:hypothetical protein